MIIVITGPTGVGKTKLSIQLAKQIHGEVINADSTQIYQGLDIATAKVTSTEMSAIPHHLLDIKNIEEPYTVFDYQQDARDKIAEIKNRERIPILVGGTGLYLKAVLYDYHFSEQSECSSLYETEPTEELYQKLLLVDSSTLIHPNNRKRIISSLTYFDSTNVPFSSKPKDDTLYYDDIIWIGLTTSRETLYERINNRVEEMMEQGLLEEAKVIYESGVRSKAVMTPIGYKELFPYFDSEQSLEECIQKIKQNSRKYAKRQDTWNRHQFPIHWFSVDFACFDQTIVEVKQYIEAQKK